MSRPLAEDLLSSVSALAEYRYGEANARTIRRCRHLIALGLLPVKKVGNRLESRKSWIDATIAEPDSVVTGESAK